MSAVVKTGLFLIALVLSTPIARTEELFLANSQVKIGIEREKGASITWLSWREYPKNVVNLSDPGRLIQQSYYAGRSLDRRREGQHKAWSPWTWNPIQGGGVGSWARVREFKKLDDVTLFAETVPKLWDMPNEEAKAVMRQWTSLVPSMPNVVMVRCEFQSERPDDDPWGEAVKRPQEIPACYFTRNFEDGRCYLGKREWSKEFVTAGPPWGTARPIRNSMAFFNANGQGIAVFSPCSTQPWNFGPHGQGTSDNPLEGPCMHVAPLDLVKLGPKSIYRFRYWLVVGDENSIAEQLDPLWEKYNQERAELSSSTSR